MASTERHSGEPTSAVLLPDAHTCRVTLVALVPFVVEGRDPSDRPHSSLTFPALEDLQLWPYSGSLKGRLRERLPHRAARVDVASGDEAGPGDLPPGLVLVDIWSFGIGQATFVDGHRPAPGSDWDDLRDDIARVSTRESFLERATGLGGAAAGPPLWAQRMLLVEVPDAGDPAAMDAIARTLSPDGEPLVSAQQCDGTAVRLGVEACVVTRRSATETWDALVRVVAAQTAIWAAVLDFDFQLAAMLDGKPRNLSLDELEQRSMHLLTLYERVQRFRAQIEMIPLHLVGEDRQMWARVNDVWRLNDQLSSLDTTLNACEHVYAHTATSLTTRQGRFLNGVVLAVTMLSLATFGLTAWDFTQKDFDAFDWLSLAVVVFSLALSVVLFRNVWSRATGRRRSRDRPRQ